MNEIDWVNLFSSFVLGGCAGNCLARLGKYWATIRANTTSVVPYDTGETSKGYRKPAMDSTLGWRGWTWPAHGGEKVLLSPVQQQTHWPGDGILSAHKWDREAVVRGRAGIHAKWPVPSDWAEREPPSGGNVVGIVERFGKYVLGEDGWRAEWVVIKELACSSDIIEDVCAAYPGIPVRVSQLLTTRTRTSPSEPAQGAGFAGLLYTSEPQSSLYGFTTSTGAALFFPGQTISMANGLIIGGSGGSYLAPFVSPTGDSALTLGDTASYANWSQASGIVCSMPMDVCPCPNCTDARNGISQISQFGMTGTGTLGNTNP